MNRRYLNCDQVALVLDAIDRYLPKDEFPAVSQQREMKKLALLYELMDVAYLEFEDMDAARNAIPHILMSLSNTAFTQHDKNIAQGTQNIPSEDINQNGAIEEKIEASYWAFDGRRKGMPPWSGLPMSERDAYKAELRNIIGELIK